MPREPRADGRAGLARMAVLLPLSIVVAGEMLVGEALFVGHIVFLVQALGFFGGLAVFTVAWAGLGLAVLAAVDLVWPRVAPSVGPLLERLTRRVGSTHLSVSVRTFLAALGVCGVLAGVGVGIAIAGTEIKDWLVGHLADVGLVLVAGVVISAVLGVIAGLGRGLVNWVRSIAEGADPIARSLGALASMIVLGPALGWLLFRLLRYSRPSVYALTLVAAPVFGVVWVPLYGLGAWGLVDSLI